MQSEQQMILNSLEGKGPEVWKEYLEPFEQNNALVSELSMLVIYERAAVRAKKECSLDWAEVAIRAMELNALHHAGSGQQNKIARNDAMSSAMQLRIWFISQIGSRTGDYVLDKERVQRWILDGLDISPRAAKEKVAWIQTELARMKGSHVLKAGSAMENAMSHLRRIKNRLRLAQVLIDCGEMPDDPTLQEWLAMSKQLP